MVGGESAIYVGGMPDPPIDHKSVTVIFGEVRSRLTRVFPRPVFREGVFAGEPVPVCAPG